MRTFLVSLVLMGAFAVVVGESHADDWRRGASRSGVGFSISYGDGRDRFSASWGRGSSRGLRDYGYGYDRGFSQHHDHFHSHTGFYSPYPVYSVPVYGSGFYSVPSYGGWHSHGRRCR
jgi:hypothetical protein